MPCERKADLVVATETLHNCPSCHGTALQRWGRAHDRLHWLTLQEFTFSYCRACGLHFESERPVEDEIHRLYPVNYPPYHPETIDVGRSTRRRQGNPLSGVLVKLRACLDTLVPDRLPGLLADLYRPKRPGQTLLDFGCGSAAFLDIARDSGWRTIGMDFSDTALGQVRERGHEALAVSGEAWEQIADHSLDVVRMNHVLEHLYNPVEILTRLRSKLLPGGKLHIAVPNANGVSARVFRDYWVSMEPRHVIFYHGALLRELLLDLDCDHVEIAEETVTKDFTRSIGYLLRDGVKIRSARVERMTTRRDLNVWLFPAARLAPRLRLGDRLHAIARAR